ncbi:MAG TPA: hypothetical protein VNB24_03900 [Acidimicrobiales bacterium]|nr:hypothetical protein [Acidimicrobiales bacterium]
MGKARGGVDLIVGAVVVVVFGWLALKLLGVFLSTVVFAVKLLIVIAVVGVGLKVLNNVLARRELRTAGRGRLNP